MELITDPCDHRVRLYCGAVQETGVPCVRSAHHIANYRRTRRREFGIRCMPMLFWCPHPFHLWVALLQGHCRGAPAGTSSPLGPAVSFQKGEEDSDDDDDDPPEDSGYGAEDDKVPHFLEHQTDADFFTEEKMESDVLGGHDSSQPSREQFFSSSPAPSFSPRQAARTMGVAQAISSLIRSLFLHLQRMRTSGFRCSHYRLEGRVRLNDHERLRALLAP